jgi:ubiquinone/menaquinone biosynthesis C-methylase UbiE
MGKWAPYYDLLMTCMTLGREKKLRQLEVGLARLKPGDNVLEIGCGTGSLIITAKEQVGLSGEAVGIDIAPEMVAAASRKVARKHKDVSIKVGSIASIPFPNNRFDAVICSFMIFHMPDDVRMKGFKEIYRVLKPGGHYFVFDAATRDKRYDMRELVPILKANSFPEIEVGETRFMFMKGRFLRCKVGKK